MNWEPRPPGTGAKLLTTLVHELKRQKAGVCGVMKSPGL